MDFVTHNDTDIETDFSSLRGHIQTTLANLIDVFGEPIRFGEGDKVTVQWEVQFDNGIVATIYDWKRYELGTPAMNERIDWNIGGDSFRAVELIAKELGITPRSRHDILVRAGLA